MADTTYTISARHHVTSAGRHQLKVHATDGELKATMTSARDYHWVVVTVGRADRYRDRWDAKAEDYVVDVDQHLAIHVVKGTSDEKVARRAFDRATWTYRGGSVAVVLFHSTLSGDYKVAQANRAVAS